MTVSDQTSILDRIKKILRKTEEANCTAQEAEAALQMAQSIAAKHNISLEEIRMQSGADDEKWGEGRIDEFGKWTLDVSLAVDIVEDFFFIRHILHSNNIRGVGRGYKLLFYGTKENVIIAKYVYDSVKQAFNILWIQYKKRHPGVDSKYRRIFVSAVKKGFCDKMKLERQSMIVERDNITKNTGGTEIVLRSMTERTMQHFHNVYPKTTKMKSVFAPVSMNNSVFSAGYEAGKRLNINRPIGHRGKKSLE